VASRDAYQRGADHARRLLKLWQTPGGLAKRPEAISEAGLIDPVTWQSIDEDLLLWARGFNNTLLEEDGRG
jgi:hypothetical protein